MPIIVALPVRGRWVACVVVALAAGLSGGCGSRGFLEAFPANERLVNESETQFLRAATFTFDKGGDANTGHRAPSGQVVIAFGDATGTVDVPGRFVASDMKSMVSPAGIITVTYEPTDETRTAYRAAVQRRKATLKPDDAAALSEDIPATQMFRTQINPHASPSLILLDEIGTKAVLRKASRPAPKEPDKKEKPPTTEK